MDGGAPVGPPKEVIGAAATDTAETVGAQADAVDRAKEVGDGQPARDSGRAAAAAVTGIDTSEGEADGASQGCAPTYETTAVIEPAAAGEVAPVPLREQPPVSDGTDQEAPSPGSPSPTMTPEGFVDVSVPSHVPPRMSPAKPQVDKPALERRVIVGGWLQKLGAKGLIKSWKARWFIFDSAQCRLYYYRQPNAVTPLGNVDVVTATLVLGGRGEEAPEASTTCQFVVSTLQRDYQLMAENNQDMMIWLNTLQTHRRGYITRHGTKESLRRAKELSSGRNLKPQPFKKEDVTTVGAPAPPSSHSKGGNVFSGMATGMATGLSNLSKLATLPRQKRAAATAAAE